MPSSATYRRRWIYAFIILFILYTAKSSLPRPGHSAKPNVDNDNANLETVLGSPEEKSSTSTLEPEPEPQMKEENVAVIIEDRPLAMLIPILLHFSSVLGPDWPIILYTSQTTMPTSPSFHRAMDEHRISIRALPADVHFENQDSVSEFLTKRWLWEQLAPAGHVLLFQTDSILCSNSPLRVDDFLSYDFVGAPIDASLGYGEGFNGGLSLRNRSLVLDITTKFDWNVEKDTSDDPQNPTVKFEDQWFVRKMKGAGARLPSPEVAKTFAVETMWYDTPVGFHQVARWQTPENMETVNKFCPEYRMASGGAFA